MKPSPAKWKRRASKPRRVVTLCKYTPAIRGKRRGPQLWAFSIHDLMALFGVTYKVMRHWLGGRDRASEGKKSVAPILDPSDLRNIVDLLEKRKSG